MIDHVCETVAYRLVTLVVRYSAWLWIACDIVEEIL